MNKNKLIREIDFKYRLLFKTIINSALRQYPDVPVEWEDIYYEFLYTVPEVTKKYSDEKGIKLETYYAIQVKHFALNKCRYFSSHKFRSLNETRLIKTDHNLILKDSSTVIGSEFDISSLSETEMLVYEEHILNYESIRKISMNHDISYRKLRNAFNTLKTKMLNQISY